MSKLAQQAGKVIPSLTSASIPRQECSLAAEIQKLAVGERFYICKTANGLEILTRDDLNDRKLSCLATIEVNKNGEIKLSDGRLSLNGVYQGNSKLSGTSILPQGSRIKLNINRDTRQEVSFGLPNAVAPSGPNSISLEIEKLIFNLKPGESCTIGRKLFKSLPLEVSREHLVIERLPDIECNRIYKLHDGQPSKAGLYIKEDGGWERRHGTIELGPGREFSFEADPKKRELAGSHFVVPEALQALVYEEELLRTAYLPLAACSEAGIGRQNEIDKELSMSCFGINPRTLNDYEPDRLRYAQVIGAHFRKGLQFLKDAQYENAIEHFSDIRVLKNILRGIQFNEFNLIENRFYELTSLDEDTVVRTLQLIAKDSWLKIEGNRCTIAPSFGALAEGVVPKNEEQHKLLARFNRELALIYGEEFIHAYQKVVDKLVSRRGIFLDGPNADEFDVAQFYRDYGVPMSELFLSRYDREKKIQEVRGIQTVQETFDIRNALTLLMPNESLLIGWNGLNKIYPAPNKIFNISATAIEAPAWKLEQDYGPTELNNYRAAHRKLILAGSPEAVRVTRLTDGSFVIKPEGDTKIFAPDQYGIWDLVKQPDLKLRSGPVRIGRFFEFELP